MFVFVLCGLVEEDGGEHVEVVEAFLEFVTCLVDVFEDVACSAVFEVDDALEGVVLVEVVVKAWVALDEDGSFVVL